MLVAVLRRRVSHPLANLGSDGVVGLMLDTQTQKRIRAIMPPDIFESYWKAVETLGTTDLIVFLDPSETEYQILRRQECLDSPADALNQTISRPASETAKFLTSEGAAAFWLVVYFPENPVVTSVIAKRTASATKGPPN